MLEFWQTVVFSLSVTGPIFILLALGVWLMRRKALNDAFVEVGSRLVFTLALPSLLFVSIAKTEIGAAANLQLIVYAMLAMTVIFVVLEIIAQWTLKPAQDRGVLVRLSIAQPMILREYQSITIARYIQPSWVRKYVTSPAYT